jgi:hypothetical protein
MKCEAFMERFLMLDNGERPVLRMRLHLLRCAACRAETTLLSEAGRRMMEFPGRGMERDLSGAVMAGIMIAEAAYGRKVPYYNWIGAGAVMFASIFLVTASDSLTWLKTHFGGNLEVPLSIVLGIVITVYAAIFAGTHVEDFGRWLRHHR